jgi:tetratricopeptide (TPR) repeat protein
MSMRGTATVCVLLALTACQRTQRDIQLDQAARMAPRDYASIERPTAATTEAKTLTVRVWVDPAYKKETIRWRERIEQQFARTTAMGERAMRIRLEVASVASWTPESAKLPALLTELANHDDGQGVDLVVALTGSFPGLTQQQHALGYARLLGKHIVVRAMNDSAEWTFFEQTFDRLSEDERRTLYRERLRHKEAAVLLHEVGHTFGALHARADGYLMSPAYSVEGDRFCRSNEELLAQTLTLRDSTESLAAWRSRSIDVLRAVAGADDSQLDGELLDQLDASPGALGPEVTGQLEKVRNLLERDEVAAALEITKDLEERMPEHPVILEHHCLVVSRAAPDAADAADVCERSRQLRPDSVASTLSLAVLLARAEDWKRAEELAGRAHDLLAARDQVPAKHWVGLAGLYLQLQMPSKVVEALDEAPMLARTAELRDEARAIRNFWCIPAGSVAPESEGRAVRRLRQVSRRLHRGDDVDPQSLRADYPDLPGIDAVQCGQLFRKGQHDRAQKACQQAIEEAPCFLAHYSMGAFLHSAGRVDAARKHLETAQQLYPGTAQVEQLLEEIDRSEGATDE